ncbi:H-NS histone family protein [Ruegeria sediminis]|uniref:H-NS histone family protein n=1 Tax=Ruegeria sediminis TaxID=2583820 RepID=A0ABY2WSR4_9RHOB|nr:H-NS histone family protein [Ruegeria sediminis]TMV02557.1 H-NS histone family protein [Ruegeria sediminis]
MNFSEMTSVQLKQLRDDVDTAIANRQRQDLIDAKAAASAAAAEYGFALSELVSDQKPAKSKAAPKYRNPMDHSQTWSGRGRKPGWVVSALENGSDISDLEI